ncbi:adenylyl cyclase X E isoform X2 [Drosophila mojavensis]|uniref:adenylate cyclase n=1 Tax=Drosophila mojavensis TaxID=7230 RepID=A0A0Q9XDS8_DROMO|nr:adenylyl cyclase X E isoform X2 [Drosophila mojavensis]KRG06752.1 uncharacterized protein Dmoj_GI11367, isoform C [Drosophila mojavensis]
MKYTLTYTNELKWNCSFLRKKCKEVGIEEQYKEHQLRLSISYIIVFQVLHCLFTVLHCILLLTTCAELDLIYVDVCCYSICAVVVIAVMWANVKVKSPSKLRWMTYVTSVIVTALLVFVDLSLNYYHYHINQWILASMYDSYVILMIYIFFPIPYIFPPMALAVYVSILYICYFVIFQNYDNQFRTGNITRYSETIVVLCNYIGLNVIGTGFRVMREIVVRASFLDRHQYVMEANALRSTRARERVFLHSILPPQIAQPIQDEIRARIEFSQKHHNMLVNNRRDRVIAIQMHPDVSILYADIVNYTHLTTTLSVKELVTLLHELYARFDNAASRYAVQRIKFLGDCYYCVAGLIKPDPAHAICCVKLGLCMIDIIREVRDEVQIGIDIRVGVHSGSLFAGVLGSAKLQYDIWGPDVLIANKLEGTGMPGQVHVSERTFELIKNWFEARPGTEAARKDAYFQKFNIFTFLIDPIENNKNIELDLQESFESFSAKERNEGTPELLINEELKKMPLGPKGFNEPLTRLFNFFNLTKQKESPSSSRPEIGLFLLHYHNPRLECQYLHQPDYMLKYSVLQAWCSAMTLIYLQLTYDHELVKGSYYLDAFLILAFSLLLILTWYKMICFWVYADRPHRFSELSCALFRIADNLQRSLIKRILIYIFIIVAYFAIISIILNDCDMDEFQKEHIDSILYQYDGENTMCFAPWALTCMVCSIITNGIIFTRIPFIMRIVISLVVCVTYLSIMLYQFEYLVHISLTTNPFFKSESAHCLMIISTFLAVYCKERQAEFNNKMNYKWRVELLKKQEDARLADQSITILLHNILPAHVVNVYLTYLAKDELYYEVYDCVAVMFASLKNFELTLSNLRVLNEIISEFDRLLSFYRHGNVVEKIKIVGSTYMAACGLDVRLSSLVSEKCHTTDSVFKEIHARRSMSVFSSDSFSNKKDELVFVIAIFALDLMRTLWVCNNDYKNVPIDRDVFTADMSIGISSGEVMAGVVGASQVHYDIWGHAVNVASRMDSTGVAGKIQVTEETANILRRFGLVCSYRGMTFVKGLGTLPTYFVEVDNNYEFMYARDISSEGSQTDVI